MMDNAAVGILVLLGVLSLGALAVAIVLLIEIVEDVIRELFS